MPPNPGQDRPSLRQRPVSGSASGLGPEGRLRLWAPQLLRIESVGPSRCVFTTPHPKSGVLNLEERKTEGPSPSDPGITPS